MIYVQFYQRAVWPAGTTELIEATSDRSVIIVDGRLNAQSIGRIAAAECVKRGYLAWQVFRGESFSRSRAISKLVHVQ